MTAISLVACQSRSSENEETVKLITLDPGHFHAALVQKSMYENVDPTVFVYAPDGPEVQQHLDKIEGYNKAATNPTSWKEEVYKGNDFFEKMLAEKKGNVIMIAGNNKNKTQYIKRSIEGGFNVLADKPMAIDQPNFELLKNAFTAAKEKNLVLYDIMTERFEITNALQKEFALLPEVFGTLQKGTPDRPAIEMESVHYFYKSVSGSTLVRPSWFMDVTQQGEGIADVAVHLVDLVQWGFFPEKVIDYNADIKINGARRWSTNMNLSEFAAITKQNAFPENLKSSVINDTTLQVFANGEVSYQLFDTYVKLIAKWDYQAPAGSGDSHYSIVRGTKSDIVIRQGAEQKFKPTIYIEPVAGTANTFEADLKYGIQSLQAKYSGINIKKSGKGWEVTIPEKYKEGHEAHFARVTEKFLEYLKNKNMPAWEVPNILAKYYTTTAALQIAKKSK